LFPKLGFIDKFLAELGWIVCRKTHQIFVDPEELKIVQIHLVDGIELRFELLRCHIDVRVVHVQRANPHEPKQFTTLLVAITRSVFRQPQWKITITAWNGRKQFMMMRAIHRFKVISL
jgi:hypothetical protein